MECWSNGKLEYDRFVLGVCKVRRNKNRGYQKLRVWIDAVEYYVQTCGVFHGFAYELKRVVSN